MDVDTSTGAGQPLQYAPLMDADKNIAELITALHHTRRPDAMSILRTGLGARLAVFQGHAAAKALRKTSPGSLLSSWLTSLTTSALDTIQLNFLSLSDPVVVRSWVVNSPALTAMAALLSHGQAADPEMADACSAAGLCGAAQPRGFKAADEQLHQDAQLCLFALAQLYTREDRPIDLDADASDSRQVHAALTALAYRLAEFANENWGEALQHFIEFGWDEGLIAGLSQSDTPEHFLAVAQVLRAYRSCASAVAGQQPACGGQPPAAERKKRQRGDAEAKTDA